MNMRRIIGLFFVLLLSYFSIRPLLASGYFPMHDDTQVARVVVMGKALQQGQFPVRWVSDLGYGYGYPLFNFYGPLPYYVGGGLYALGVDSVVATKIMFGIGMILAPMTLFLLVESLFGGFAGVAASMLFLYAPYHAVEVYIRGSVGEYWAIAFIPLLLYGLRLSLSNKKTIKGICIGSLSLAAIILSHTILGFVTCVFLGIGLLLYWCIQLIQKKLSLVTAGNVVVLILIGLGLSAFFWLPAFVELPATSVRTMVENTTTSFFDHFVCIDQLWNSPWRYGGSAPGCVDGMSFKFGKFQVLLAGMSFLAYLIVRKKKRLKDVNKAMVVSVSALVACVLLMLPISTVVWRYFPFTAFIQYPWRLLAFGMMLIAVCGSYIVSVFRMPILRMGLMAGIVIAAIVINAKIFTPQYIYTRDSYAFETIEELRYTRSKISDEYLPPGIVKPNIPSDIIKSTIQENSALKILSLKETDVELYAEIESTASQSLHIQKAWFPGWIIMVNGKQIRPDIENGVPVVNIPSGISIIQLRFIDTPVRMIGNMLSICSLIIIGALYVYGKKTNT